MYPNIVLVQIMIVYNLYKWNIKAFESGKNMKNV